MCLVSERGSDFLLDICCREVVYRCVYEREGVMEGSREVHYICVVGMSVVGVKTKRHLRMHTQGVRAFVLQCWCDRMLLHSEYACICVPILSMLPCMATRAIISLLCTLLMFLLYMRCSGCIQYGCWSRHCGCNTNSPNVSTLSSTHAYTEVLALYVCTLSITGMCQKHWLRVSA